MIASLVFAAALVSQAPRPAAAATDPATVTRARTIRSRQGAAALKQVQRNRRAQAERYAAHERMLYEERMAPIYAQQQAAQAQAYYQQQAGQAMENLGIAARQDAETNRLRYLSRYGPGPLMILNAPRVVTPSEVIQSQLGPH